MKPKDAQKLLVEMNGTSEYPVVFISGDMSEMCVYTGGSVMAVLSLVNGCEITARRGHDGKPVLDTALNLSSGRTMNVRFSFDCAMIKYKGEPNTVLSVKNKDLPLIVYHDDDDDVNIWSLNTE